MPVSNYLPDLASFVPNIVKQKLVNQPELLNKPSMERFEAAVLFADISGFTALTEQMAAQGPQGVEDITHILNDYFTGMIESIHAYGGDVVKFAGDALLAIWPKDQNNTLTDPYLQAASCALALQQNLRPSSENVVLRIRIGLGAGETVIAFLGGMMQRWEFVIIGDSIRQAGVAQTTIQPGQVAISTEMGRHLVENAVLDGQTLLHLNAPAAIGQTNATAQLSTAQAPALQAYIPHAIVNRLNAGQAAWMAELRRVTVLFIELPDYTTQLHNLDEAQTVLHTLQEILYTYEGSANKIAVDEKGVTLLAALGLPPFSHSDDPLRAVLAALDIVAKMKKLGLICRVGIASGRVFCGAIGSPARREYTMIGKVVNLAARLKVAATLSTSNLNIFCDTTTWEACSKRIRFESLPAVKVKGIDQPVPVYAPVERLRSDTRAAGPLIGRSAEKDALTAPFAALKDGKGQVTILEGEAGMGKSRLVEELLQSAERANIRVLAGAGDAIEKSASYHPWRPIFRQLFGLEDSLEGLEAGRQGLSSYKGQDANTILAAFTERLPKMVAYAPLLNVVLPIDLPDNEITRHMRGENRAQDTQQLLLALLEQSARATPTLLVIEDAHWLDSASWALVRAVAEELPDIYLLLVTRPLSAPIPADYQRLTQVVGLQVIQLQPMPRQDTLALVAMRLGVQRLPDLINDLITEKAEGHPFFSEELAYALRDAHLIEIKNGECILNASIEEINSFIPNTVEGVVTSRIDRLTPQEQLTLKVASVIGRVFALRVLRNIHPIDADRPLIEEQMLRLQELDLTPLDAPPPDLTYIFKHIITQEVAYNLMLFTQRKQLHRSVAEWYEQTYTQDISPYFPLLAYHYAQSEDRKKAIEYLVKAGEQSLRQFANQEAVRFFCEALELAGDEVPRTLEARIERARWERWLGQAHLGMGNLPLTKKHLYRALELLGRRIPTSSLGVAGDILGQVIRQIFHLIFPGRFVVGSNGAPKPSASENERLTDIFNIYDMLFEIFYFVSDRTYLVLTGLNSANVSEQAVPFAGRAKALLGISVIVGLLGLKQLAERYQRQALEISDANDDLNTKNWVTLVFSLHKLGVEGTSPEAKTALIALEKSYESIGDRRHWGEARTLLCEYYFCDAEYEKNIELAVDMYNRLQRSNEIQQKVWALQGMARCFLVMNEIQKAIDALTEARTYAAQNIDQAFEMTIDSLLALAYTQTGEYDKAYKEIQRCSKIILSISLKNFSAKAGFENMSNALLNILEDQAAQGQALDAGLLETEEKILRSSREFAKTFTIHTPSLYYSESRHLWLMGNPKAALVACQKSLELARLYHLPYTEGMALYELGRHAEGDARRAYLQQAREIFTRIKAYYDLKCVVGLLSSDGD